MKKLSTSRWQRRKEKFRSSWDKVVFNLSVRKNTTLNHEQINVEAETALADKLLYESHEAYLASEDPLVRQGWALKQDVEGRFRGLLAGKTNVRILIQVPAAAFSPAGYSLFTNLAESLAFIGVPTRILAWEENSQEAIQTFNPTVLLTSDHESYLSRIDWTAISQYRQNRRLLVGLTASLEEYDSAPLKGRLQWARNHEVDFFYTFRDQDYVQSRIEYQAFFDAHYKMLYVPFGANILHYFPVAGYQRDIDFVLMATRKSEHMSYMKDIVRSHVGFIDGPGWRHVQNFHFNRDRDRYIYARARVGLNVHLPEQIEWACEVNERTYQLAACGVPQLVDHPKLIDKIFSREALFVADTPAQYTKMFHAMLGNPEATQQRALVAQSDVFSRHTTFHRAYTLIKNLEEF